MATAVKRVKEKARIPKAARVEDPVDRAALTLAFDDTRALADLRRISHRDVILEAYSPGTMMRSLLIEKLELECPNPTHALVKRPIDPEVQDFREGFDENKIVQDLGHTPNAMAGAIVDSARSKREAANDETNGRKSETKKPSRVTTPEAGRNGSAHKSRSAPGPGCEPGELFESTPCFLIPLSSIVPDPKNARKTFDKAKLESLAASLKANGQDVPCKVRPAGQGRYMLIEGERRFRAAKIARLGHLRCEIADVTDQEARERALVMNLQREDLNPIERAIGYKQLLDDGKTQQQVAELFGLSGQAAVSNAVRILELPTELREKVGEGKLSATQAVMLVPHARRPAFVKEFVKDATREDWDLGNVRDFNELIGSAYGKAGIHVWNAEDRKLAEEHEDKLDLVTIETPFGRPQLYVMEKKAFAELRAARERERTKARDAAEAKKRRKGPSTTQAGNRDDVLQTYLVRWFAGRIAAAVRTDAVFCAQCLGLMLQACEGFAINGPGEAARRLKIKWPKPCAYGGPYQPEWKAWRSLKEPQVSLLMTEWVANALEEIEEFRGDSMCDVGLLAEMARSAGVDLAKSWEVSRDFLLLCSIDELVEMAVDWKLLKKGDDFGKLKHSQIVAQVTDQAGSRRLPTPTLLTELAKG